MNRSVPKFVFMGSPSFAVTILNGLLQAGWIPALVVTEPPKPVGRKQQLTPTAVETFARVHNLPVATPATKEELCLVVGCHPGHACPAVAGRRRDPGSSSTRFRIRSGRPGDLSIRNDNVVRDLDLIIVAAYGKILPQAVLDLPRYGAVNVHASLLPKYRGASPIQAALLSGDTETGITFMAMEAGLDTGPIVATVTVPITQTDTTSILTEKLAAAAATSIVSVITSYLSNPSQLSHQDDVRASFAPKLTKEDGKVSLTTLDPITLDRMIRAYSPWPGVYTEDFPHGRLKILAGKLTNSTYTITKLQWAGKSPVDGETFARSYPDVLTKLPPLITLGLD